jgi:hypothetical protein
VNEDLLNCRRDLHRPMQPRGMLSPESTCTSVTSSSTNSLEIASRLSIMRSVVVGSRGQERGPANHKYSRKKKQILASQTTTHSLLPTK